MVSSPAMGGSEGLGYGTQIMLDGAYAEADKLTDREAVRAVLKSVVAQAEPNVDDTTAAAVVFHDAGDDGLSAALIRGETAALLHAFPNLRTVTLHLFTAHDPSLSGTTRTFLDAFGVGRFQSSVRAYGHYPPRNPAQLELALAGLRSFARIRVTPSAAVTT